MKIVKFIIKKLCNLISTLFVVSCITFILMNSIPGNPFLTETSQNKQTQKVLEEQYGLEQPLMERFVEWGKGILYGDWGISYNLQRNRPVLEIIKELLPNSLRIGLISLILSLVVGICFGCLNAFTENRFIKSGLNLFSVISIAIPGFVFSTLLLIVFCVCLKVLPTSGLDSWQSYILPCVAQSIYPTGYIANLVYNSLIEIQNKEYILTAVAYGCKKNTIVLKYSLTNALFPVFSYLGTLTSTILVGSFATESIFNISGLGRYFVKSIINRDYSLIMGITLIFSIITVVSNMIIEILYFVLNPKLRNGETYNE